MSRRRQPKPSPEDARDVHREILDHLERNPPPETVEPEADTPARPAGRPRPPVSKARPAIPTIMLRQLRLHVAEERLLHFLRVQQRTGTTEVLVVVGRGHNSPGGEPVLGPAIRRLCDERTSLVESWREAPTDHGGVGALVVRLRPSDD